MLGVAQVGEGASPDHPEEAVELEEDRGAEADDDRGEVHEEHDHVQPLLRQSMVPSQSDRYSDSITPQ